MQKDTLWFILLAAGLLAVYIVSLFIGRYWVGPLELLHDNSAKNIVWNLRVPRIIAAALVGLVLGLAGATLQAVFRNPLASPSILGISQGASFGAALAILFVSSSSLIIEAGGIIFGLAAFGLMLGFFTVIRFGDPTLRLLLAGMAVAALFSGGVGILTYVADPQDKLPQIAFWLLGGLYGVLWRNLMFVLPLALAGAIVLFALRWRLNLLTLQDDLVLSLGHNPRRLRIAVLIAAVGATAAVTALAGVIAWVGLIVPYIARSIFGSDNAKVLPASALMGAILMMVFDDIARTVAPGEIPLGIVASVLCVPIFVLMLARRQPNA